MSLINRIKYTNRYPHINKFLFFLKLLKKKEIKDRSLSELVKEFDMVSVLCSGPSLNKCINEQNKTLFVTTNSSYLFLKNNDKFVHIIRDFGYLKKFLFFGLKYKPLLVIIDIHTFENGKGLGGLCISYIKKYLGRVKLEYPVVITSSENNLPINMKNYSNDILEFMNSNKLKNPNNNSGLMIYGYGVWITSNFNNLTHCNIYGLDAGEGGQKYFNGSNTLPNHVAMRNKNKKEMKVFIENAQNKFPFIKNYSYFMNNVNN